MIYNPGGQLGKRVQGGGQRPAKGPRGPFLGKSAMSKKACSVKSNIDNPSAGPNSRHTGIRGGKGKQDIPEKQKR
jgi:hypothetical protein